MTTVIVFQIIMQIILKGSIDDIWNLFLMLQLIAFMSLYATPVPANVEIYVWEFRKMITFHIFKPDNFLPLIEPGLTMEKLIGSV